MVTPFGGASKPLFIDLFQFQRGQTVPEGTLERSLANGTTNCGFVVLLDWDKMPNTVYWLMEWGHNSYSTAAGAVKMILHNYSNNSILYTFSSNTSSAASIALSTLGTVVIFTKPNGQTKIGVQIQNNNTNAAYFYIFDGRLMFI